MRARPCEPRLAGSRSSSRGSHAGRQPSMRQWKHWFPNRPDKGCPRAEPGTSVGILRPDDGIAAHRSAPPAHRTVPPLQLCQREGIMSVPYRLPPIPGVLLLLANSFAGAETPLPDPVAPAVVGRPLAEIKPVRPARQKPAVAKADRPLQLAATPALRAAPALAAAPAPAPAVAQAVPVAQQAP